MEALKNPDRLLGVYQEPPVNTMDQQRAAATCGGPRRWQRRSAPTLTDADTAVTGSVLVKTSGDQKGLRITEVSHMNRF